MIHLSSSYWPNRLITAQLRPMRGLRAFPVLKS
jgi:hypothetical protein